MLPAEPDSVPTRASTNASGVAVLTATPPEGQSRLVVSLTHASDIDDGDGVLRDMARYRAVTAAHSYRQYCIVPVPAGTTQLSLDIVGRPCTSV